ncbi:ABC transporter ATP-binding protein [Staphylococcus caeli]|uniref:ABC transporter ATP-binding protein n=1 Tax=Staphylococcus caeli TaxID=2201815 RepID=UPI003F5520F9
MIEIQNLSFNYANGDQILKDINLTVKNGEVICLTGASGCGKTTLTNTLNGIIPHFYHGDIEGDISINGVSILAQSIYDISKQSGSVFQNPRSQFFCLNTTSELAFEPENYGVEPQEIKTNIAETTKILHMRHLLDREIFNLSGGEKQLIACAAVQIQGHELIILDEPSSNLDFKTIIKLRHMLEAWKSEGKTIIIAEHRLHYLMEVVDRFVVLKNGKLNQIFSNAAFKQLTQEKLYDLGLRATHLRQIMPKVVHNEVQGKLVMNDFHFKYKSKLPLSLNISNLEISKGKVTAIVGHNGSGKSTFARCLTGIERKFKGHVQQDGNSWNRKRRLNHVYLVMQDVNNQLFAERVDEELKLSNHTLDNTAIQKRLSQYSISEHVDRHPLSLSGGEKQRLAIASAVETKRDVLIFDEPSSGLDGARMREMSEIINHLASLGHTIFVITHDYELLLACADEVIHLEHGYVKQQYPMDDAHLTEIQQFFEI